MEFHRGRVQTNLDFGKLSERELNMNYGKKVSEMLFDEKNPAVHFDAKQKFFYLQHQEGDYQFQIKFKDAAKYGILIDYIAIGKSIPLQDVETINQRLDEQADAIQKRITFLLEEFKLIEMDIRNKRAQLRSYPPHTEDNAKYYYEIVLDEGVKVHFQRYQFLTDEKRYAKITSQLTMETFERLINELVKILA